MSASLLIRLRIAATLATWMRGVGVALEDRGRVRVAVGLKGRLGGTDAIGLSPAAFRLVVARAHHLHVGGHRADLCGLALGDDPLITLHLGSDDAELPGGVYRFARNGCMTHAVATTLDAQRAHDAVADTLDVTFVSRRPDDATNVSVSHDRETGVTVLHTTCRSHDAQAVQRHGDVVGILAARCLAHELVAATQAGA